MIKLTYKELDNPAFLSALRKIRAYPGFKNFALAFNGGKIAEICDTHWKEKTKRYMEIARKYAVRDDVGDLVCHEGIAGTFIIPDESCKSFEAEMASFMDEEVEIDRPRFMGQDLSDVGLAPIEVVAIEKLVKDADPLPPLAEVTTLHAS